MISSYREFLYIHIHSMGNDNIEIEFQQSVTKWRRILRNRNEIINRNCFFIRLPHGLVVDADVDLIYRIMTAVSLLPDSEAVRDGAINNVGCDDDMIWHDGTIVEVAERICHILDDNVESVTYLWNKPTSLICGVLFVWCWVMLIYLYSETSKSMSEM